MKERLRPDLQFHVAAAEVSLWDAPNLCRAACRGIPGWASPARQALREGVRDPSRDTIRIPALGGAVVVVPAPVPTRPGRALFAWRPERAAEMFAGDAALAGRVRLL